MTQDTKKKKLIINKLTTQQYLDALDDDLINDDELYMTTDAPMVNDVTVGGSSIVSNNTVALGTMALETASDYSTKAVADTLYADIEVETTKVDKVSTANKVYGTDSTGAQTTYDKDSFGHVDDVQVGGSSVVVNKIASLGTMASRNSTDYRTASAQDTIDATKLNISDFNTFTSTLGTMAEEDKDDYYTKVTANATFADIAYEDTVDNHIANTSNPHQVTKAQVGLGNVDNTSDANKPVSTAQQTALDGKVDKTGTANQVYGTSTADTQTTLTYSKTATANTIAQRDTGGVLNVGAPTADTNAATKKYVDDQDALKVDKTGTANQVYGTGAANTQTTLTYDKTATANTIVQRDTNGVVKVGTASADTDAVNKKYFNDNVGTATTTALGNKVDVSPLASIVYGTDSTTAATTYNVSDLTNLVNDVTVGGTSVVTNKVAVLGSMAGESASDYATTTALSQEVTRATDRESALNTKIETETTRASGVEAGLQSSKADKSTTYTKTEVDGMLSGAMHFKGSVPTVADLPATGNTVGDMYTVTATGANYAWDGTQWVKMSETVDLSDYALTSYVNTQDQAETTRATTAEATKVDKVSTPSRVYGTDEHGNQITYGTALFGNIDDVTVGGTSVVTNRVAPLGSMAGETASDYSTKAVADTLYAAKSLETTVSNHTSNTSNPHSVTKAQVGLGNVDNTADLDKPISTATQTALDGKVSDVKVGNTSVVTNMIANLGTMAGESASDYALKSTVDNHIADTSNPHNVTAAQIGLGNVNNTSDANKPVSTAQQAALNTKVDKVSTASKVYGTDSTGAQTTYDYNALGKVDDVKVAGTSVVTNKVANLGTMASETASNYYKKTDLASIATSGSWNDLSNTPTTISGYGITDAYTKTEIDGKLSGAMHFKGTVATVAALPSSGQQVGDMYNVTASGANYAWDGTQWDKLSENVDLSGIYTKTEVDTLLDGKEDTISDLATIRSGAALGATALQPNTAITAATHTKITYDTNGLVTSGTDLSASDIPSLTLSKISDVTATAAEVNVLDGITASTSELNILDGVTADANELNILDGATLTTTELNYVDGVTSSIQTQLNSKQATLVSGSNIKTINSTSLLGSGDVSVQPTLVSGTNIKTIGGNSLLGSGNIDFPTVDSSLSTSSTNAVQNKVITNALNGKLDGFTLQFAGNWTSGVHAVNFVTIDYSECNSENGVFIKFSMVNSHGNGQAGRFLQDVVLNVKYTGEVAGTLYRYFAVPIDQTSSEYYGSHSYGDVFWVNDTTNKIVKFYVLMHQYSYTSQSPYFRLNASTKGVITQSTGGAGAEEYSSGTRVWTTINWLETDQTYSATSAKPQSGVAVASAISGKANDSEVVHKTGTETITGAKTFENTNSTSEITEALVLKADNQHLGTNPSSNRINSINFKDDSDKTVAKFSSIQTSDGWSGFLAGAGGDPTNPQNNLLMIANGNTKLMLIPPTSSHSSCAVRRDFFNNNAVKHTPSTAVGSATQPVYVASDGTATACDSYPTVNNATLTITQGGTSKGTFTANADTNVTIALDGVPSVDQTYDGTSANAQSGTAVAEAISTKQATLVSGTNIKTINSTSLLGSGDIAVQPTITGAATTITSSDLTASKALISNASGKVAVSDTTSTELGYVHGVTSAIQTQLDSKQDKNYSNKILNTNTTAGAALLANQFVFMNNNNTYPATNKTIAIEPGYGIQLNTTAVSNAGTVNYENVRQKYKVTDLTNIPHATLTTGCPCYFRCTNTGTNILSDNYIATEMTADYTWYYIGIADSATSISVDTTQSFFVTLNSSGKIERINGKELAGGGGSGGSSSKRVVESFTATANQTTFTVTEQIINKDYVSVNVDNVELTDAAYSLSNDGMSVILGTGVAAGALVDIKYFADISLADSGATFTPTVTKSGYTTTMSWSNDRSLPNPNTVSIYDGVIYTPSQTKSGSAAVISWTNNQGKTNPSSVTLYDGVTFTPSVTVNQAAQQATLSWTNDGGKTNPDPLTIYLGQDNTTQRLIDRFTATANQTTFVATHDIQGKNVLSVNVDNSELLNDGFTLANDKRTVTLNDACAAGAIVELKYFHNLIMAQDGNTYTPHVSKSNYTTTLSWTNDGGLENPSNVSILDGVIWTPAVTATTGGYNLSWTNDQGKTNPSTVFINGIYPAGVWASASTYKPGYMVTYEDTNYQYGYIAKQNVPAGTSLTNTTYWMQAYAIGKTYIAATVVDWGE